MAAAPRPALHTQSAVERKRAAWGRAPGTACMHATRGKPIDTGQRRERDARVEARSVGTFCCK
eukprot:9940035-Lingulodinium_polyedra.AAC.1